MGLFSLLIGMMFPNPLLGWLGGGCGAGAISGKLSDYGIGHGFIKSSGANIQPGTSALFASVRKVTPTR